MMNDFQEAIKAIEIVWNFERRTVLEGVTHDDIRRAVLSVDAIDMDSLSPVERDMAELLHETVREACRIYEYREKPSGISTEFNSFRTFSGEEFRADSSGEIRSAIHKDGLGNVVRRTIQKINSPESGESESTIEKMEEGYRADSTEISDMTIAEIISSQTAPDESEEYEPVLDKEHEYIADEDDMETADSEEEMGDALGKEGLERYNQEVWDKLEEKKERQRKRAEEKKRTDRWFRRLRAKQEAEREIKLKREAEAKAIEEQNRIQKRHAEESARGIAFFQRKQRVYDSKKEREAYERETTRKHMAEQEELRAFAQEKRHVEESKRRKEIRERVRETTEKRSTSGSDHSGFSRSDKKVNGKQTDWQASSPPQPYADSVERSDSIVQYDHSHHRSVLASDSVHDENAGIDHILKSATGTIPSEDSVSGNSIRSGHEPHPAPGYSEGSVSFSANDSGSPVRYGEDHEAGNAGRVFRDNNGSSSIKRDGRDADGQFDSTRQEEIRKPEYFYGSANHYENGSRSLSFSDTDSRDHVAPYAPNEQQSKETASTERNQESKGHSISEPNQKSYLEPYQRDENDRSHEQNSDASPSSYHAGYEHGKNSVSRGVQGNSGCKPASESLNGTDYRSDDTGSIKTVDSNQIQEKTVLRQTEVSESNDRQQGMTSSQEPESRICDPEQHSAQGSTNLLFGSKSDSHQEIGRSKPDYSVSRSISLETPHVNNDRTASDIVERAVYKSGGDSGEAPADNTGSFPYGRQEADNQRERIYEEYEIRKAEDVARNSDNIRMLRQKAEENRQSAERFREEHYGPERVRIGPELRYVAESGVRENSMRVSSASYDTSYRREYGRGQSGEQNAQTGGNDFLKDTEKHKGEISDKQNKAQDKTSFSTDINESSKQKKDGNACDSAICADRKQETGFESDVYGRKVRSEAAAQTSIYDENRPEDSKQTAPYEGRNSTTDNWNCHSVFFASLFCRKGPSHPALTTSVLISTNLSGRLGNRVSAFCCQFICL